MSPISSNEDELDLKLREFEKRLDLTGKADSGIGLEEIYDEIDLELESKEEKKEIDFRQDFIATFVKNLIRHSYRPFPGSNKKEFVFEIRPRSVMNRFMEHKKNRFVEEIDEEPELHEKDLQEEKKAEAKETEEAKEELKIAPKMRRVPIKRLPKRTFTPIQRYRLQQRVIPNMQKRAMPNQPMQRPMNRNPQGMPPKNNMQGMPQRAPIPAADLPLEMQTTDVSGTLNIINLGRISHLLQDPSVFSIECPGPEKYVLVNKAGRVQTTSIMLSKDEINAIMGDVSDKTRIPILGGLFKAAIGNILITAIISDYIGTRFVFQKRMPFKG